MTTEQEGRLRIAAATIALSAPLKPHKHVSHTLVPWSAVEELRDALTDIGIDWRKHHRDNRKATSS